MKVFQNTQRKQFSFIIKRAFLVYMTFQITHLWTSVLRINKPNFCWLGIISFHLFILGKNLPNIYELETPQPILPFLSFTLYFLLPTHFWEERRNTKYHNWRSKISYLSVCPPIIWLVPTPLLQLVGPL